jgi:hypothetical protein
LTEKRDKIHGIYSSQGHVHSTVEDAMYHFLLYRYKIKFLVEPIYWFRDYDQIFLGLAYFGKGFNCFARKICRSIPGQVQQWTESYIGKDEILTGF